MNQSVKRHDTLLAVFISIVLILTSLPIAATAAAPISIGSAAEFELIRSNPDGNFILTADITLSGQFTPLPAFRGILDGNGYRIFGLSIRGSQNQKQVALIREQAGTVKRLGLMDVSVQGVNTDSDGWAGGIAVDNRGTIEECFVTGSITGGHRSAGIAVNNFGTIKNSYSNATVSAKWEGGGIVSVLESTGRIENCYAVPNVTSSKQNTGGIAAYTKNGGQIKNCAVLSGSISNGDNANAGRIVGKIYGTAPTLQNNIASAKALVQGAAVSSGSAGNAQGETVTEAVLQQEATYRTRLIWNFSGIWTMDKDMGRPVLGRVSQRIPLANAGDLERLRTNPSGVFELTADITPSGSFRPIASFRGVLTGNGYSIRGMKLLSTAQATNTAFIIENFGVIRDIGFSNVEIEGSASSDSYVAAVTVINRGRIEGSYVNGRIHEAKRSAAFAIHNFGTIKNSYSDAQIRAVWEAGGIAAINEPTGVIEFCYAVPDVFSSKANTGGIAGYANNGGTIRNCALLAGNISNLNSIAEASTSGRMIGKEKGSATYQGNIASAKTLVQRRTVSGGSGTNQQGLSMDDAKLRLQATYRDLGWDFTNVWVMSAGLGRPVLRQTPEIPATTPTKLIGSILSDTTSSLADGISYRQLNFTDTKGYRQNASILSVDLSNPQNRIMVGFKNNKLPRLDSSGNYVREVDANGKNTVKDTVSHQASSTMAAIQSSGWNVIAGVNGEFYTDRGPEGYMVKDGTTINAAYKKHYPLQGFLGVRTDGSTFIGNYGKDWAREKAGLTQASGGAFQVVENGAVPDFQGGMISTIQFFDGNYPDASIRNAIERETVYRYETRHPRTAVGMSADGTTLLFVVVDGRGANGATGVYIEELGLLLQELGAHQALNMDGGGSSTAVGRTAGGQYQVLNTPINSGNAGVEREVFSSVLVLQGNQQPNMATATTLVTATPTDHTVIDPS